MKLRELKIEIMDQCPLKCIHCSTASGSGLSSLLSPSTIENLIGQADELGCEQVLFSGGEPLLHPCLEQLLAGCHSRRLSTKLYTSGIESTGSLHPVGFERLKYLKAKGLDGIAFSLYSSRKGIHDRITGTPGSFVATVAAIRNSVRAGITTEVHFVATKINITELGQLSDFVLALGVKHISVLRFVPQGRGKCNSEQLIPTSQDFGILRTTIAAIRQKTPVSLRLGSPFNFLLLGHPSACTTGTDRMIIDAHCLAHPCDALKRVALPDRCNDALTTPLVQIIDKDSVFRTIRNSSFAASCKSCPDLKICRGGCPAQRFLINGDQGTGRDPGCLREGSPIEIVDM